MTAVRVRGIYATALTALFDEAGLDVVQSTPPIRRRFDRSFGAGEFDAAVETTADRQGVCASGDPDAVEAVRELLADVAIDTLTWSERAARTAVFDAVVERTGGGGAVLDLGGGDEAYLPYGNVEARVEDGDAVRVQVVEPSPPWSRDRPVVDGTIRVPGGVATLVRGVDALVAGTPDGRAEHELARTTELLPTDVPDGWGVRWEYAAEDAEMGDLDAALAAAVERADDLDAALAAAVERADDLEAALAETESGGDTTEPGSAGSDEPGLVAAPWRTAWCWFGRESRFALDDVRASITTTLPGHHRIKAAHDGASGAVDFAERLGASVAEFPFGAVVDQFGPGEGDRVAIEHGKPDGRLITLGRGRVTDVDPDSGTVTVRREMTAGGTYDALGVPIEAGDVAVTKFREGRWWYPTVYRADDGTVKGSYVNVSTPVEVFPSAVRYVDLQVDVIKHADGSVEVVDEDDLQADVDAGHVSEALAGRALDVAQRIARGIGE